MSLYFSNSLSQHVNIDMILCVDCMLMKNVKKIPLVQHICMDARPLLEYSNVNPLVSICVTINFIDAWINKLGKNIA